MAEKSAITLLLCLKVKKSVDFEVIDEKGYKMRKEYIKPEAEMMKFLEEEEIMLGKEMSMGTIDIPEDYKGVWQ